MVLCCFSHIEIFIKILSLQPLRIHKLLHWDGFMLLILNICLDPIPSQKTNFTDFGLLKGGGSLVVSTVGGGGGDLKTPLLIMSKGGVGARIKGLVG